LLRHPPKYYALSDGTIFSTTMERGRLFEIAERLRKLRITGGVGYRELESVAGQLGRSRRGGESGSHGSGSVGFQLFGLSLSRDTRAT